MEHNNTPIENQGLRNWIKENEKLQSENNQYKKAIAQQAIDSAKIQEKLEAEIERLKELS